MSFLMRRIPVLGLIAMLLLGGCAPPSFLRSQMDNFTAYYNTFYNARKVFEEGRRAVEKEDRPIDMTRYLSLFPEVRGENRYFERAIKKAADLLRKHPHSKWVDDALLLIGKSYFYQQNYVGAEQKFREVIELGTELEAEARFWLARTLIASEVYDEARTVLEESLLKADLDGHWKPTYQLMLGEMYARQGAWEDAIQALEEGIKQVKDKDLKARALFLLGQVYEATGNYEKAAEAFARVLNYHPLYELAYAAELSRIRVLGLHGNPKKALALLERMERDDKHFSRIQELYVLKAQILARMGKMDEAWALYQELLYGEEPAPQAIRGEIHYRLAELYRDVYRDYRLAAAHYDTAATRISTIPRGERVTPVAIIDTRAKAEVFRRFTRVAERVSELDSLLYLGSLPPAAFDSVIYALRVQRARELEKQQKELERQQASARFQQVATARTERTRTSTTRMRRGEGEERLRARSYGFLFHKNPLKVKENLARFREIWGGRPLVPNWRRQDAISNAVFTSTNETGVIAEGSTTKEASEGQNLPELDLSAIPRDSLARQAMRVERATARYELANVLFLSLHEADSAAAWYRKVIEEDEDTPVAPRAWYALAEVFRARGDTLGAQRLYREALRRYPTSPLAVHLRKRLTNIPDSEAVFDTLAVARKHYEKAYRTWQHGDVYAAMKQMKQVVEQYTHTPAAARALLSVGIMYWQHRQDSLLTRLLMEWVGTDSTYSDTMTVDVRARYLVERLYRWIEEDFPGTPFSQRARMLLKAIKEELLALEAPQK